MPRPTRGSDDAAEGERARGCARHEGYQRARTRIEYLRRLRAESAAAGVRARRLRGWKAAVMSALKAAAAAVAAALL